MSGLDEIAGLLQQAIGLDAATAGPAVIGHAVKTRMAACGLADVAEYAARVRHSEAELQELIEAVVVPETWFFRDETSFAALTEIVMKEWLPARPTGPLRLLSVPCSTGEEPYSIAMALLEAGLPPPHFTIDALDVSTGALARAKHRVYGRNAFRGSDLAFRARHFRHTPEGYELEAAVAKQVQFQRGNLIDPELLKGAPPYDVIFCRNVLIYFDRPTQERVLAKLETLLARTGVLFVAPAEVFLTRLGGFRATNEPGAFASRRAPARSAPAHRASSAKRPRSKPARSKPTPAAPIEPRPDLASAQALADAGRLREALAACGELVSLGGASAGVYFLMGLIHGALGQPDEAAQSYRKAVYLEPEHPEALRHLALLAEKRGDSAGASRLQRRVRRTEEAASR
jgi:chemotaxis protein methyltransferase WspC